MTEYEEGVARMQALETEMEACIRLYTLETVLAALVNATDAYAHGEDVNDLYVKLYGRKK